MRKVGVRQGGERQVGVRQGGERQGSVEYKCEEKTTATSYHPRSHLIHSSSIEVKAVPLV